MGDRGRWREREKEREGESEEGEGDRHPHSIQNFHVSQHSVFKFLFLS